MLNEMMDRPIIKQEIVDYLRTKQRRFSGPLGEIEAYANAHRVPIIPHETAVFLDFFLGVFKPKKILEIGTAIGFSASLMARQLDEEGHIITIDRFEVMYSQAKQNFLLQGLSEKITQLEGDAADILPTLDGPYQFIFMDSAKAKYYDFFPYCMKLLPIGGVLMVDDIFQGGTITQPLSDIPRKNRKIHKKLNQFLDLVQMDSTLKTTLLPLGDGIILIEKLAEKDFSYLLKKD